MERRVTTQDISWFLDLNQNRQLDLNPPYQRRSVWSSKDRKFFLDTIFRGYPSPTIFLHKNVNENGKTIYFVVDGKQRLETIFSFIDNKISLDKEFGDIRLNGKKWRHIQDVEDIDLRRRIWDYVLPVEFISVDESGTFVNEVFDRLNRNSRKLVDQELRHAKYDGWFINFAEIESDKNEWVDLKISTRARAKRMRDVQFISELMIVIFQDSVSGFNQNNIDFHYAKFEDFDDENNDIDINIDEENFKNKFDETKMFLLDCEKEQNIVTLHSKDFKYFYSLWSCIALNQERLLSSTDFCTKYDEFMTTVEKFIDSDFESSFNSEQANNLHKAAFLYYRNSIGANTEGPQRLSRHQALMTVIFGDSLPDED